MPMETVAVFRDVLDAELARSKLLAEGIDAELADCATIGIAWNYSNALGGVKVLVPSGDVDQAAEILRTDRSALVAEVDAGLERRGALVCPECGSEAVEVVNNTRKAAAWFMLLGIPLVWFDKHERCGECRRRR